LPLANAVHQLNARYGGGRVPETFEAAHRVCSGLYVAMVLAIILTRSRRLSL
jgi:hypothetical protein